MKVKFGDTWRLKGKTLKESWYIALHDLSYWITILVVSIIIVAVQLLTK